MPMNLTLLDKVAKRIASVPVDQFNLNEFFIDRRGSSVMTTDDLINMVGGTLDRYETDVDAWCGSAACIAGHAFIIDWPATSHLIDSLFGNYRPDVWTVAKKLLGLTERQALRLFINDSYFWTVEVPTIYPAELVGDFQDDATYPTSPLAVQVLNDLVSGALILNHNGTVIHYPTREAT